MSKIRRGQCALSKFSQELPPGPGSCCEYCDGPSTKHSARPHLNHGQRWSRVCDGVERDIHSDGWIATKPLCVRLPQRSAQDSLFDLLAASRSQAPLAPVSSSWALGRKAITLRTVPSSRPGGRFEAASCMACATADSHPHWTGSLCRQPYCRSRGLGFQFPV